MEKDVVDDDVAVVVGSWLRLGYSPLQLWASGRPGGHCRARARDPRGDRPFWLAAGRLFLARSAL